MKGLSICEEFAEEGCKCVGGRENKCGFPSRQNRTVGIEKAEFCIRQCNFSKFVPLLGVDVSAVL